MSSEAPSVTAPDILIRQRMRQVKITQTALSRKVRKSQAWVSQELLGQPEETLKRLWIKEPEKFTALALALEWPEHILVEKIGLSIPVETEVATSSRTIPTHSLTISSNRGELMQSDILTVIPEAWAGEYKALKIDNRTLIYQVSESPKEGDIVVLDSGGILIGRAVSIKGKMFFIELDHAFSERTAVVENPSVLGVVKEERISY